MGERSSKRRRRRLTTKVASLKTKTYLSNRRPRDQIKVRLIGSRMTKFSSHACNYCKFVVGVVLWNSGRPVKNLKKQYKRVDHKNHTYSIYCYYCFSTPIDIIWEVLIGELSPPRYFVEVQHYTLAAQMFIDLKLLNQKELPNIFTNRCGTQMSILD